jgi:hypothetical protein
MCQNPLLTIPHPMMVTNACHPFHWVPWKPTMTAPRVRLIIPLMSAPGAPLARSCSKNVTQSRDRSTWDNPTMRNATAVMRSMGSTVGSQ